MYRPTCINVDCNKLENNIKKIISNHSKYDYFFGIVKNNAYHHGIYVSDLEVIHFTGTEDDSIFNWSKNEVIKSDLKFFLSGGNLEVREYTENEKNDLYPAEHIIHYARTCLGDRGYNLLFNNCEHFANVCTLGRFRSLHIRMSLTK